MINLMFKMILNVKQQRKTIAWHHNSTISPNVDTPETSLIVDIVSSNATTVTLL